MGLRPEEKEAFGKTRAYGDRPPNVRHGKYLFMIENWRLFRGFGGLSDVHTLIVAKSESIIVVEGDKVRNDIPNEVGSRCGVVFKWAGRSEVMARTNSDRFLLAMLGITDKDISDDDKVDVLERLTNDDPALFQGERHGEAVIPSVNPCRGMLIAAETAPILTRETKQWIVGVNFAHVAPPGEGDNSYPAAAKRWAEYEAKVRAIAA